MERLRTPNFVLRRLIFVKPEIQIYQHTGNRLMERYSLTIWLPESTFADSSVTHSFWGKNRWWADGDENGRNGPSRAVLSYSSVRSW